MTRRGARHALIHEAAKRALEEVNPRIDLLTGRQSNRGGLGAAVAKPCRNPMCRHALDGGKSRYCKACPCEHYCYAGEVSHSKIEGRTK